MPVLDDYPRVHLILYNPRWHELWIVVLGLFFNCIVPEFGPGNGH